VPRRRNYGRYRKYRGRRRTPLASSQKKSLKLQYQELTLAPVDQTRFPAGTATVHYHQFKLNSAYDVNNALANTVMPGFTEHAAFYQRYRVNMAVLKTTFVNMNPNAAVYVGMWVAPETQTNISGWTSFMELKGNPWVKRMLLGPSGSSKDRVTMSMVVPFKKLLGNALQYKSSVDYTAACTTNPAKIIPGYIYACSADGTTNTGLIQLETTVTQYITMYSRFNLIN